MSRFAAFAWLGLAFELPGVCAHAADPWQVATSPLRYRLSLATEPTHASAGYFVRLPDGGLLRGTLPVTTVLTDAGQTVPSYALWNNGLSGFTVVFAAPPGSVKSVDVYMQVGRTPQPWRPETGITPSAILGSLPGRDSLGAARALASFGRVDATFSATNEAGIPKAPFSIGGDLTGRPRPGSFYLLSYVVAPETGKYWFAPIVLDGECEVQVDGAKLVPREHSKLWGGTGAFVDLTAGLHRVEVFQTAGGTGPYSSNTRKGGLMFLTWRTPKEQLRGVEARILKDSEIARSGTCELTAVEARDGSPVAVGTATPGMVYWFENEEPLIIYDLSALNAENTPGTTWTWSFPDGSSLPGSKVQWIFPGFRDMKVQLTAKSAQGTSTSMLPFFTFGTDQTSLESSDQRDAFRTTLAAMLKAYPRSPDPTAAWSVAWWNNLLRTIEGNEGYSLLVPLFTNHFEVARKQLSPAQLASLENLLLDLVQRKNPAEALQWVRKFQVGAPLDQQAAFQLREGELQMYYLGDRKQAAAIFTKLATLSNETGERAKIRLGDLALITGDLNKASALYADVQNRARGRRNGAPAQTDALITKELIKDGAANPSASTSQNAPTAAQLFANGGIGQNRGALQEVSLSENVRTLTEGGFFLEARRALDVWEREFPLTKISGDYIIVESTLEMKMEDETRARPMLEAYCREIDASSYLPQAASMLIECVQDDKSSASSIREVIEKVRDRLKYHPVAKELDEFLSTTGKSSP